MKIEIKKVNKKISERFHYFCYWHVLVRLILFLDPWPMGTVCTVPYHCYLLGTIHWWKN